MAEHVPSSWASAPRVAGRPQGGATVPDFAPPKAAGAAPSAAGGDAGRPERHGGAVERLGHYVRALRPRQWSKNVLVFMAPAAAGVLSHGPTLARAVGVFGIFCLVASGTYLLNDAMDAEADRRHPKKRHRPVAAGAISPRAAVTAGLVMAAAGLAASWLLAGWQLFLVLGAYVAIPALGYSLWLKREPVLELGAVATGFVLRAVAGGVGTHVPLSNWFLVVTSFGALFIVAGKRAAEHHHLGDERGSHRAVLDQYSSTFLTSTLVLSAGVTVTAYCLWAFDRTGLVAQAGHHPVWIQLSVAPVVLGILYVMWLLLEGKGGAPEDLVISERRLQVLGLLWMVLFLVGIYS